MKGFNIPPDIETVTLRRDSSTLRRLELQRAQRGHPGPNFKYGRITAAQPNINGLKVNVKQWRGCRRNTTCWDIYLKGVRAVAVDMSEVPIKLAGIVTLLHVSKYYAPPLHFKLKHKKRSRSIYNVQHQMLFPHTQRSAAAKPSLASGNTQDFVTDENFRLTPRSTHPRSSALIRERDNC